MKPGVPRSLALLFSLWAAVQSTVVPGRAGPKPQSPRSLGDTPVVAAITTTTTEVHAKTLVLSSDELVQRIESYGHQAWETANELKTLVDKSGHKNGESAALTPEESAKVAEALEFVREANRILKYYIDHYVLTEKVLKKYEKYIESHPGEASSTNGVLKFMVHEFRDIHLRSFEHAFFEKVKMYNSVVKEKFTPLLFLPVSDPKVHALQVKLLNGERLIVFIKKYMAFVRNLKQRLHLLDYEKDHSLFPQSENDPDQYRLKVVSKGEFNLAQKKKPKFPPVTIIIGNEPFGAVPPVPAKAPSDFIEHKEEVQVGLALQNSPASPLKNSDLASPLSEEHSPFKEPDLEKTQNQVPVASMSHPERKQVLEAVPASEDPPGDLLNLKTSVDLEKEVFIRQKMAHLNLVSSPDTEKDSFMRQKMAEVDRLFGKTPSLQSHDTLVPSEHLTSLSAALQKPDPLSFSNKPVEPTQHGPPQQGPVKLDKDGMPTNLVINRVPEILRKDERFQDPLVIAGKPQTGLTSKVARLEDKLVSAPFRAKLAQQPASEPIPSRREIYRPNEVNGGLPAAPERGNGDTDLNQLDEVIKDNGQVNRAVLRQVDSMLGLRGERRLWDGDLGALYSRLIKRQII